MSNPLALYFIDQMALKGGRKSGFLNADLDYTVSWNPRLQPFFLRFLFTHVSPFVYSS